MIPRRLIRTVPAATSPQVEQFWEGAAHHHPGWELWTFRDPVDPAKFPLTSPHWSKCSTGAQLGGLIRLEALWTWGGIYLDSDVQVLRSLEALLTHECFAAWEDANVIPDAIIGARDHHPAIRACIALAVKRLSSTSEDWRSGHGAWSTGPGVTTTVLPVIGDVKLYGPEALYPVHYSRKEDLGTFDPEAHPEAFTLHHWFGSWLACSPG